MSRPTPDEQPTRVIPQQTIEQPAVSTAPPTRRARTWHKRIPARMGRARTSTVVIGSLFLLLFALYSAVKPAQEYKTFTDPTSGVSYRVPVEDVSPAPTTPAPATTSELPPSTSVPSTTAGTSGTTVAPRTSPGTTTGTTTATPSTRSSPTEEEESTTAATTRSRVPSTSAEPSATEEPGADETTSAPTS